VGTAVYPSVDCEPGQVTRQPVEVTAR